MPRVWCMAYATYYCMQRGCCLFEHIPPPMHPSAHDMAIPDVAAFAAEVGQRRRQLEHSALVCFRALIASTDASADVTCWTVQPGVQHARGTHHRTRPSADASAHVTCWTAQLVRTHRQPGTSAAQVQARESERCARVIVAARHGECDPHRQGEAFLLLDCALEGGSRER